MTKAQLRESIKREARIKTGTNLDGLIDDIVADILRDYCNLSRYYETLKEGVAITLVNGQKAYSLPADFQNLSDVRFGHGPSITTFRSLSPQANVVKQTYSQGYPLYYRLIAGPKISFWPFGSILATDQLLIDYYADLSLDFTDESDPFPIPRLKSAVKKDAIARLQRVYSALQEAQVTDGDGKSSFIAAQGASGG